MLPDAMTKQTRNGPKIGPDDLTAKAKIRNAALELFGAQGEDGTSMRAIATAAGVTVGLLVHHFGTKDGIRDAVEDHVVDHFVEAIASAGNQGSVREVAAARDRAVAAMLDANPDVVNYMRRALLDPTGSKGNLLTKLTELTRHEVTALRNSGVASTVREESSQVIETMIRQFGQLFLQPMVDAMWQQLTPPDAPDDDKPALIVTVRKTPPQT